MAGQQVSDSSSDNDGFHSLSVQGEDDVASEYSNEALMAPPIHPVPQLQAAFEESILESTSYAEDTVVDIAPDADMRRRRLLEAEQDEHAAVVRWKQRPDAKYHPFVKLIAQLVFGMHLLKEGQAKSNEEVVKILQNHVNDVDGFLERTAGDFDLAIKDIEERIRCLKLPMQHMDIFEVMLDEKKFRSDLLSGNEKIEKIIARTAQAMNAAMHDIHNGIKSTKELGTYLNRVERRWPSDDQPIAEVFAAMRGNELGWMSYLRDLRTKGDNLRNSLVILETVIGEIARHAAAASRRNKTQSRQVSAGKQSGKPSPLRSKFTRGSSSPSCKNPGAWLDKPLPKEPGSISGAKQAAMAKPHLVPLSTRFEQPRQTVPAPRSSSSPHGTDRPRTSSHAPAARDPTTTIAGSTHELPGFIHHHSGPLRSHPPDMSRDGRPGTRTTGRSQSQGGKNSPFTSRKHFRRSQSQGAAATMHTSMPRTWSESREIPRQPVGSATRDDDTAPDMLHSPIPQARNGFSRRVSKRLKHIQAPLLSMHATQSSASAPNHDAASRPIDSTHSFARGRDMQHGEDGHDDPEKAWSPDMEKHLSVESEKDDPRSESRGGHRLFPNVDRPMTPLQAVRPNDSHNTRTETFLSDGCPPGNQNTHCPKASRTVSLRKFFSHRKGESRNIVVL